MSIFLARPQGAMNGIKEQVWVPDVRLYYTPSTLPAIFINSSRLAASSNGCSEPCFGKAENLIRKCFFPATDRTLPWLMKRPVAAPKLTLLSPLAPATSSIIVCCFEPGAGNSTTNAALQPGASRSYWQLAYSAAERRPGSGSLTVLSK